MPRAKSKSKLGKKLGGKVKRKTNAKLPLWQGPENDGPQGGITQSLLQKFLNCRERFRVRVVEGLTVQDRFNHRLEYGQMWHICEEAHAEGVGESVGEERLLQYVQQLARRYRTEQEQVRQWYNVCKVQFPIYVEYWRKHKDVKKRKPLLQEEEFKVPYALPSGRTVYLRGKWDSVDLIGSGRKANVWLQENKTKGDIKELQLQRQLTFDLQTMFYSTALVNHLDRIPVYAPKDFAGVRYNVVRRPLSGGKGSIRQHKPTKSKPAGESNDEFYTRLAGVIEEQPDHFFMRWNVPITPTDIERFRHRFLNPVLEQLCDWWLWISTLDDTQSPFNCRCHWQFPFGVYNPLTEGVPTDLDNYLETGDKTGLETRNSLFPELE